MSAEKRKTWQERVKAYQRPHDEETPRCVCTLSDIGASKLDAHFVVALYGVAILRHDDPIVVGMDTLRPCSKSHARSMCSQAVAVEQSASILQRVE